jgi:hypothetical protein
MSLKNYRWLGEEAEILGTRLDSARKSLVGAQSAWAKNYWTQAVDRLLFQWRQLPVLHDADAQVTIVPRWTITYDFYENHIGADGFDMTDRAYHKLFRDSVDLDASWENHRAKRLARAQF